MSLYDGVFCLLRSGQQGHDALRRKSYQTVNTSKHINIKLTKNILSFKTKKRERERERVQSSCEITLNLSYTLVILGMARQRRVLDHETCLIERLLQS